MPSSTKSILLTIFKLLFAAAIMAWLFSKNLLDFSFLTKFVDHPFVFLFSGFLMLLTLLITNERWRILLQTQDLPSGFWQTFKLTLIGIFFNFAMPGGIGGDVIKSYYLIKNNASAKAKSIISVLLDRLIGLHVMVFIAVVAMLSDFNFVVHNSQMFTIFVILAASLAAGTVAFTSLQSRAEFFKKFWAGLFSKSAKLKKFEHIAEAVHKIGDSKTKLFLTYLYSAISQIISIGFMYYICTEALGLSLKPTSFFIIAPIGFILTALPISPAGVGVGQAAFLFLFQIYDPENKIAGPSGLTAFQTFQIFFGLIGGLLFILNRKEQAKLDTEKGTQ